MSVKGVQLPVRSASKVVWEIIKDTTLKFPEDFSNYKHPQNLKIFSKKYHLYLQDFEVCRGLSEKKIEIARFVLDKIQTNFLFCDQEKETSLKEFMQTTSEALELKKIDYPYKKEKNGYSLCLTYEGKMYQEKEELLSLPDLMLSQNILTTDAMNSLKFIINRAYSDNNNGQINLAGQKFVLLGGTAELSPIRALLQAGAKVFTTGTSLNEKKIAALGEFCGELYYCSEGMDLLTQPHKIAQSIVNFAENDKIHLGIFAYKGGQGREWKLTTAMDSILRKIKDKIATVCYYPSPSVITEIPKEVANSVTDPRKLSLRQKITKLLSFGSWYKPNIREENNRFWVQTICNFQGCSYAAANLFGKYYAAEVYHQDGIQVSVNIGPVTATSSMDTPFLRAAFKEARRFSFHIFEADETREILQALWLSDILQKNPSSKLVLKYVHSGIFTSPWLLNGIVEEAAIIGNIKRILGFDEKFYAKAWRKRLQQGCVRQAAYVNTPTKLEYIIRGLQGDLATAFCGGKNAKVIANIFLGNSPTLPKNMQNMLPKIAKMMHFPIIGKLLAKWGKSKKLYGNLLITVLWSQKRRGDRISLTTNTKGELSRICLHKTTEQNLEFTLHDGKIRQTLYFGRALADGSKQISLDYEYDKKKGVLKTTGPTAIAQNAFHKVSLKPQLLNERSEIFTRLIKQSAEGSITFPVNSGILEEALETLKDPQWQVDFTRVTVYAVAFEKIAVPTTLTDKTMETSVEPVKLVPVDKGEILTSEITMAIDKNIFNRATISLLIRGNTTQSSAEKIPRIEYRNLKENGKVIEIVAMNHKELIDFAALNGDHNPLHQIKGAALMVGFKDIINPGLGSLSQIESAVRSFFGKNLTSLTGTIVRPVYPENIYLLECSESDNQWQYQLVDAKNNKVIIDGSFIIA